MELTDLVSEQDCARFEKEAFERFHINCTVFDASGTSITGRPNWCNRLCPVIKANKDSLVAICATGNQNFMARAKQTGKPVIGECDAGFVKIAVPLFADGDFVGIAGGCGLLPPGGAVETYLIEKTVGIGKEQIAALCDGLGTMTVEQAEEIAVFIERRIEGWAGRNHG